MVMKRRMKSIMKTGVVLFLLVMTMCFATSVYAAPDVLPAEIESSAEGLVTLKAPEQLITSTNNKKLPIDRCELPQFIRTAQKVP